MADRLNWTVGHEGKGNVYDDGSISTWNIDATGDPQHQQVSDQENEWQPAFLFYITADGGVNDGGIGFNNTTFKPDTTVIAEVCHKDPQLYDASDEEVELDETPREHYHDMGYGHAQNVMDLISKVAGLGAMHSEFKIPRHIRRKIRKWADKLEWPEGSEQHDARKYHITVLTFNEYCPDFVKFMSKEMRGREFYFKSDGFDIFKNMLVLRLESPAWERLAIRWGQLAADKDLEPRRFPGGPKCHITIGEVPEGKWPQGVPDPNIEFTTKMFNVNINKTTARMGAEDDPELPIACPYCGDKIEYWGDGLGLVNNYSCRGCKRGFSNPWDRYSPEWQDSFNKVWNENAMERAEHETQRQLVGELKQRQAAPTDPLNELEAWLKSAPSEGQDILPIHYNSEDEISPQPRPNAAVGPHLDPPSHPYKPYDWAAEKTSDFARTSCQECGFDHPPDTTCPDDYANAKRNWYDRVWSEPGSPTEFPHQPRHWKHDHAPDVNQAQGH